MEESDTGEICKKLESLNELINRGDVEAVRDFIISNRITSETYKDLPFGLPRKYEDPIQICVAAGNAEILSLLLSLGIPLGVFVRMALFTAIENNHLNITRILIENGVEVNSQYSFPGMYTNRLQSIHRYPLRHAASIGDNDICKYLLSVGADTDPKDSEVSSPLICAARIHKLETCRILLEAGADVESLTPDTHESALIEAVKCYTPEKDFSKCPSVVKLLMSYGADPDRVDKFGCSSVHYASHSYDLTWYFIELNVTSVMDNKKGFHNACVTRRFAVAALLVKAGFQPSKQMLDHLGTFDHLESIGTPEASLLASFLRKISENPRSLQELCCFKVRRILGRGICTAISTLPLPTPIRNYLLLKNLPATSPGSSIFKE